MSNKLTMSKTEMGTCHGLSKLPYMRDTRRSIGLDNFVMKVRRDREEWRRRKENNNQSLNFVLHFFKKCFTEVSD